MDDFDSLLEGVDNSEELKKAQQKANALEAENTKLIAKMEAAFNEKGQGSSDGKPMMLPIDDVIEDPERPNVRQERNPEFEQWLTENIKEQAKDGGTGVQDPISVRWSEEHEKWIINKGHTRHICGKKAGLKVIPAYIQDESTDWNGVIENLIREGLTTKDMVDFIARKKSEGVKQTEIAKRLSRDTGWVSKHVALTNPPQYVQSIWDNKYATDFSVLYGLVTAYKKNPELTEKVINEVIADKGRIAQDDVASIAKKLDKKSKMPETESGESIEEQEDKPPQKNSPEPKTKKPLLRLEVTFEKQQAFILIQEPESDGNLVLELASGGVMEAPVNEITIIGVTAIEE